MTVAGIEGIHKWTEPGAAEPAIELGRVKADDGSPVWPRFVLDRIGGLGSVGEGESNRDRPPGGEREILRRSERRGRTLVYEGRIQARTLRQLRDAEAEFRAAFDDTNGEGRVDVSWHPLLAAFEDVPPKYVEAQVLTADIADVQDSRRFERAFVVSFRQGDRRYFEEAAITTSAEVKETDTAVSLATVLPDTTRGPVLELGLPASAEELDIIVKNATTGQRLVLAIPAGWAGDDLTLDFLRRTIRDASGGDRSALLDPLENDLWMPGAVVDDIAVEVLKGFSEVNTKLVSTPVEPGDVAVDATYMYWADGTNIGRAKLDGTEPNGAFLATPENAYGVAVNATHLFWADFTAGTVGRATLAGAEPNINFITAPVGPISVVVNATHIFWADATAGTIGRATVAGGSVNNNFITAPENPTGIAIDGTYIYWIEGGGDIGRAKLDGTEPNGAFIDASGIGKGLEVNSRRVFWSFTEKIGRANLDGSLSRTGLLTAPKGPEGIAVNATYIYWADEEEGSIGRARLNEKVAVAVTVKVRWDRGYY